jgi:predicted ATPase
VQPGPHALVESDLPVDFGRYRLVGVLGAGGMGRVFRAQLIGPEGFRKELALKVIARSSSDDRQQLAEFSREARFSGLLKHPNIVDVYDFGVTDGHPWLAMELLEGQPLAELLCDGALPPTAALDLAIQVGEALACAHALEVDGQPVELVHRDLKPGNVVVSPRGLATVLDFGLARAAEADGLTASGMMRGTPAYMAPEQARGEAVDPRTDLFALGLVLFEALTGTSLLLRDTLMGVMMAIVELEETLEDPAILAPAELAAPGVGVVLRKLLRAAPGERYPRASEVVADLRVVLAAMAPGPDLRRHLSGAPAQPGSGSALIGRPELLDATLAIDPNSTWSMRPSRALARKTNLGPDGATFVGRGQALSELAGLVDGGARLVTLLGPGGTGKTRLARRFAWSRLAELLPRGGAWFCDLSEARSGHGVLHVVAVTLGIPLDRGDGSGDAELVGQALADRGRMLVVLDNLEQVVGDAVPLVERWLGNAPELLLLVTSRERLRLPAESVLDLAPLGEDEGVALFEERARAVRAGFVLKEADREVVRSIVRRLDGLPLAIELAAARAAVMAPRQLLARLDQRFRLLSAGPGRDGGRRATLWGAIRWSWDLLDVYEQRALARASVFRGGFTLELAEAVLADPEPDAPWPLDLVQALRDKSLLRSWEQAGLSGEVRFGMYESLQAFASEQLDGLGIRADAEARHADAVVELGEELAEALEGKDGRRARLRLTLELDNLNVAWERRRAVQPDLAVDAVLAMAGLLQSVGPTDMLRELLDGAVQAASADPALRRGLAQVLLRRAALARHQGRVDEGLPDASRARELADAASDPVTAVMALAEVTLLQVEGGRLSEAAPTAEEALTLARAGTDREALGVALNALAFAIGYAGDLKQGEVLHEEALAIWRELGNLRRETDELAALAAGYGNTGRVDLAAPLFERALKLHRELGTRRGEGMAQANLALVALQRGRLVEARRRSRKAASIHRSHGNRTPYGVSLCNLGNTLLLQGELDEGLALLTESVRTLEGVGMGFYTSIASRDLALARLLHGQLEGAEAAARASLALGRGIGSDMLVPVCSAIVGAALAPSGQLAEADSLVDEARRATEASGDEAEQALVCLVRAFVDLNLPLDPGERAGRVAAARALHARYGYPEDAWDPDIPFDSTLRLMRLVLGRALERELEGQSERP